MSFLGVIGKQLKSHPALIPLFIFIGGGVTMSGAYLARLALKNPDVSWDRKNNPEPWNKLEPTQQYKVTASHSLHNNYHGALEGTWKGKQMQYLTK
ncbi:cytochrome c oxidase subunit NDUFA4-like [Solea senegalensis]|uniref:Cytochrome c oxidase subunit NDUFA4 n=1 Tax=Solea senegalensis TaxID=28829 RepID=A0AAV6RPX4_SOLSE|nr:cytochrome c oxidase subunit NDUFA4-like [Solea senegalensis]